MYRKFGEPIKVKSFKAFLNEVNYGSFEKDERIKQISDKIKKDMLAKLSVRDDGEVRAQVATKTKNPELLDIRIQWEFLIKPARNPKWFCSGAGFDVLADSLYLIVFDMNKDVGLTIEEFIEKLTKFVKSGEINEFIYHEVKHLLDEIDGIYKHKKYVKVPYFQGGMFKYISQDKEIHNFLLSTIAELEHIHKKHPEYTYEKAIENSSAYQTFLQNVIPSKRNKIKTKIAHFWYSNFVKEK